MSRAYGLTLLLLFWTSASNAERPHMAIFNWRTLGKPARLRINNCFCVSPRQASAPVVCVPHLNIVRPAAQALMQEFSQNPEKALSKRGVWGVNVLAGVTFERAIKTPELLVYPVEGDMRLFVRIPSDFDAAQLDAWISTEGKRIWGGILEKMVFEMNAMANKDYYPLTVRTCDLAVVRRPGTLSLGHWGESPEPLTQPGLHKVGEHSQPPAPQKTPDPEPTGIGDYILGGLAEVARSMGVLNSSIMTMGNQGPLKSNLDAERSMSLNYKEELEMLNAQKAQIQDELKKGPSPEEVAALMEEMKDVNDAVHAQKRELQEVFHMAQ